MPRFSRFKTRFGKEKVNELENDQNDGGNLDEAPNFDGSPSAYLNLDQGDEVDQPNEVFHVNLVV